MVFGHPQVDQALIQGVLVPAQDLQQERAPIGGQPAVAEGEDHSVHVLPASLQLPQRGLDFSALWKILAEALYL